MHCIYEQRDNEGNILFEGNQDDEDEITISVQFLQPPSDEVTRMVQTKVSYRFDVYQHGTSRLFFSLFVNLFYTTNLFTTLFIFIFVCIYGCR